MRVFLKNLRKGWFGGIIPPLIVSLMAPVLTGIWPSFKEQAAAFAEILKSPVYKALLGEMVMFDISTWEGMFYMYIGLILEYAIVFVAILVPVRLITNEVDKNTLDVTLSYPIPRWRYILEKFGAFMTYSTLYPIILYTCAVVFTNAIGETMDFNVLIYSFIGAYLQLIALGAISLLCGAVFLESSRALSVSGALILAQYVLTRLGDLGPYNFMKDLSLFKYVSMGTITKLGEIPLNEVTIVIGVGLVALTTALYVFQKRELAF